MSDSATARSRVEESAESRRRRGILHTVLAVDYDGTLATHGQVDGQTLAALEAFKKTGRGLVLVTGRQVEDVLQIAERIDLFDRIVGENGAVVYSPADRRFDMLGEAPPAELVDALRGRNVSPLSVGRVIVSTWEPNQTVVLDVIRDLGLELQVIFNKGAVMVLPAGINKASGLERALKSLQVSAHNTIGIGDAENDHAFLAACETAVAVANAVAMLKSHADWVTPAPRGLGVVELIDRLVTGTLSDVARSIDRHRVQLGTAPDGAPLSVPTHGTTLLIAGASGSGKSTIATAILEQLLDHGYQCCLIDPEGDYSRLEPTVVLGDERDAPTIDGVLDVLRQPAASVVAVLLGLPVADRPNFFARLLARAAAVLTHTGRPHWLVIDEAHHLLANHIDAARELPSVLDSTLLITAHPEQLPEAVVAALTTIVAIGPSAADVIGQAASRLSRARPVDITPASDEAVAWFPHSDTPPVRFRVESPRGERQRHRRKYAEGTLGPDKSFYFRGPEDKLRLRAQNLAMFLQMADGVDDDTWRHHLRRGDYSAWIRDAIKDEELAREIAEIEGGDVLPDDRSRSAVAEAISRRYTQPG
jgi:hydroxymethylpyrimidine pyrophosphatase-like HAD family hydrolase